MGLNETRSIRAACPYCKVTALTGQIYTVKNIKLDNGDPDYRQYTMCSNCDAPVFVVDHGLHLEPGAYDNA